MKIAISFVKCIVRPITSEWAFFLLFAFLISQTALKTLAVDALNAKCYLSTFLYLSLSAFISYLFTTIVYLSRSRVVKAVFYTIGILLFGLYMFLWCVFGTSLSPVIIQILGETNANESREFASTFISNPGTEVTIVAVTVMVAIIVLLEKYKQTIAARMSRHSMMKHVAALILLAFLLGGVYKSHIYITLFQTKTTADLEKWCGENTPYYPMDMVTTLFYSLHGPVAIHNDIRMAKQIAQQVYHENASFFYKDSSLTVIYILGESYIKSHAGIYGYTNETTPFLKGEFRKGNLIVFDNVNTPYASTTDAEKNTFCCNSLQNGEHWYEKPLFQTVFKRTGFNVYYWDIQKSFDDNAVFTFSVNSFIFDPTISRLSYDDVNKGKFKYDGELVNDFYASHSIEDKLNLVMFHFLGQHVGAGDRYPHEKRFERFSSSDIKRKDSYLTEEMKKDIAQYDNATYYNDYVLSTIINRYRNKNAVLLYLSDHGEEIYDWRPSKGRKATPMGKNVLKYQFSIPFMVWCSDTYQQQHPDVVAALRKSVDKPMSSDILCHMLFHLGGVSSSYYNRNLDILSPSYQCPRRLINGQYDYDEIMLGKSLK